MAAAMMVAAMIVIAVVEVMRHRSLVIGHRSSGQWSVLLLALRCHGVSHFDKQTVTASTRAATTSEFVTQVDCVLQAHANGARADDDLTIVVESSAHAQHNLLGIPYGRAAAEQKLV